ncbi:MAG: undecaprenyldiphospho-muramoylpentapeptide beta-N-acetylglucosaminyltransferase [Psittacicella sp.]
MTKKILIAAGGTGGHIFPALEIAKELQKVDWEISWLGTQNRMESSIIPNNNIPIYFIKASGVRGSKLVAIPKKTLMLFKAVREVKAILRDFKPDLVLGMGGYISGIASIACINSKIPFCLHEQNSVAGLSNLYSAKFAKLKMEAFKGVIKGAYLVGNPISNKFYNVDIPEKRWKKRDGPLRIFIMGGSQGAKILNSVIPEMVKYIEQDIEIIHQAGKAYKEFTQNLYKSTINPRVTVKVHDFIDDVLDEMSKADLVISRSGAMSVFEIAAVKIPAVFIPYEHKDKQQYKNAKMLVDNGSAIIMTEKEFTPKTISKFINSKTREDLLEMALKSKENNFNNAVQDIVKLINGVKK